MPLIISFSEGCQILQQGCSNINLAPIKPYKVHWETSHVGKFVNLGMKQIQGTVHSNFMSVN